MSEDQKDPDIKAGNGAEKSKPAAEPEYVVVAGGPNDEPIELPTNADDNTLGMSTLTHAFPGAHGLKFKNPKTGASRALLIDATGTKFFPPHGGWAEKLLTVIYHTEPTKRAMTGEQNPKRKKMMEDPASSDSENDGILHGTKLLRLNKEEDDVPGGGSESKSNKSANEAKSEACTDLLILGLPFKLDENELKAYFETFGSVDLVEIKKDSNGESRGFGFVRMSTITEQHAVLDSSHNIGGRKCHVKFPLSKSSETRDNRTYEDVRLFVGHLSEKVTTKRLREFFGNEARKIDPKVLVTDAFIPTPFRHFAFINLSSPTVAKELLKKDNFEIDGNSITLSIAAPKQQQLPYSHYGVPSNTSQNRRSYYHGCEPQSYLEPWDADPRVYDGKHHHYVDPYDNSRYESSSPYPNNSQSIATGLENLNMKTEVMNEALKAFWTAARSNHPPGMNRGAPGYPQGYRAPYPRRGHPASSPSSSRWR